MSMFKVISKSAMMALTAASICGLAGTAQAQTGKRIVVAMAPSDVSDVAPVRQAKPNRVAVPATIRAKRVAAIVAPKAAKEDCFWCNREVFISGLTY